MKLSRLYSNNKSIFPPIELSPGLNAVVAEIRLPENKAKDTHNLGKSTLGLLIDFCLLAGRDNSMFLFKHADLFSSFVFYLEILLLDGTYITVRRGVEEASKISIKKHQAPHQDFSTLPEGDWDHYQMPFDRAKDLLDAVLDLRALKPWSYRKGLGYLIRSQDDYQDVFHLRKFAAAHSDWKPYLAHILGFNASSVESLYRKEEELAEKEAVAQTIKQELGGSVQDISKIEGILLLKQKEADKKQQFLAAFDFRAEDKLKNKALVDQIDERISTLNSERYSLSQNRRKILASLEEDQILFDPSEAQKLFAEVGVLFPDQVRKDYEQLIGFNRAITEERKAYLEEERTEIEATLKKISVELNDLGKRRSAALAFLTGTDAFEKYKQFSNELVTLRADIAFLERQRTFLRRLQDLRAEVRTLNEEKAHLQSQVEADVEDQNANSESLFSAVRLFFSQIIEDVISRKALLSVSPNQFGHLEFKAEILDESGKSTSADMGHTYRKLLCIAFDFAVLRAHIDQDFPKFVYHDGVFESLDNRKKENLIDVIREYCGLGIQNIITLIDSDIPRRDPKTPPVFSEDEIVIRLHDEGPEGRLFRMKAW